MKASLLLKRTSFEIWLSLNLELGLGGVQMNVIRHDPEKLARSLVKIFKNHSKLQESV